VIFSLIFILTTAFKCGRITSAKVKQNRSLFSPGRICHAPWFISEVLCPFGAVLSLYGELIWFPVFLFISCFAISAKLGAKRLRREGLYAPDRLRVKIFGGVSTSAT